MSTSKSVCISAERSFLESLFTEFEVNNIRYAVMRNFENLPYNVMGGDLDILFHPNDLKNALTSISLVIKQSGGAAIGLTKSPGFHQILAFGQSSSKPSVWWGLCLDLFDEVLYRGAVPLLDSSIWTDGCEVRQKIHVLKPGLAAVLGVLKEVLYNNKMPLRYRDDALTTIKSHFVDTERWLSPLGVLGINQLRGIILQNPDAALTKHNSSQLRRYLVRKSLFDSPFKHIRKSVAFYTSRVARIWNPAGLVVAIIGTDGVGKSTIISSIDPILSAATHSSFIVKHLRPGLLPPLARIKGVQSKQIGPVTNPHQSIQSGVMGSLVRIIYLTADYILGYWLIVWPKIAKVPSSVFVFDRYAYDMMLDQKRFRIDLPRKLVAWFNNFAPKPDIIFCLYASPSVIAKRKQELPMEEIIRQIASIKIFSAREKRAVLVSSEGTIEETRDRVLTELRDYCTRRTGIGLPSE